MQALGIDRMSVEERLRLLEEIWDSITLPDDLPIPESHKAELERRIAAADAEPASGVPWEEAKKRLWSKE
jgi:putative addiction module component (TIGR02574 family)